MLAAQPCSERPQLAVRLFECGARLQAEQRLHEMRAAAVLRQVPRQALPDVGIARELKFGRHHAGDRERLAVESDDSADDGGIGFEALPP